MTGFARFRARGAVFTFLALLATLALPAVAAAAMDLRVASIGNPPTSRQAQRAIAVTAVAHDAGTTRVGASSTSFWLSVDRVAGKDRLLGLVATKPIAARGKLTIRGAVKLPASTPAGSYFLVACTDHARRVRESNERNNCLASTRRITVIRPTIAITAPAAASTTDGSVTLAFTTNEPVSATCAIDGGPATACASGAELTLGSGSHTIAVRGVDTAGNVATATSTWTVDATAPVVSIVAGPAAGVATSSTTAAFGFSTSEQGTITCQLDGGAPAPCTSPWGLSSLGDGAHSVTISVTDSVGNTGSASHAWSVDATAPDTIIAAGPTLTNDTTPTFSFSTTEPAAFECKLDNGAFAPCTSPFTTSGLSNGLHEFTVRGTDALGNLETSPAVRTITVDTIAPTVTMTSNISSTNDTTPSFSFMTSEIVTYSCRIDASATTTCTSPFTVATPLANGSYTFFVVATDQAGNTSNASADAFTIDTVAPVSSIVTRPAVLSNTRDPYFTLTANEIVTYSCRLSSGFPQPCPAAFNYYGLADGPYTLNVVATDAAGNPQSGQTSYSWTIDATAPVITFGAPTINEIDTTVNFTITGATGSPQCAHTGSAIEPTSWASCDTSTSHTVIDTFPNDRVWVRAVDSAGNISVSSFSF